MFGEPGMEGFEAFPLDRSTVVLPERPAAGDDRSADEGDAVDRAALAQEFSRLLQEKCAAADG